MNEINPINCAKNPISEAVGGYMRDRHYLIIIRENTIREVRASSKKDHGYAADIIALTTEIKSIDEKVNELIKMSVGPTITLNPSNEKVPWPTTKIEI